MDDGLPGYGTGNTRGVFLAKIDTAGEVLWHRYAKGGIYSDAEAWNMVVKDDRITIAVGTTFSGNPYAWFYLFDTMIVVPAGRSLSVTKSKLFFVSYDGDGNKVDLHNIQLFAYSSPTSSQLNPRKFGVGDYSKFCIDQDNNIHLLAMGIDSYDNSEHGA